MDFKIYGRRFYDGVMVVGSQEVENPQYDGKCFPAIDLHINTGEIMGTQLLPDDSDFWADADEVSRFDRNFYVHALGGREKVLTLLEKIVHKIKKLQFLAGSL